MDEFQVPIDINKFRKTNNPWNELMLNDPWSVGYVSQLIELKTFNNKEEWEKFYYEMGAYRQKKIAELDNRSQNILNNEELIRTNKSEIYKLPKHIININKLNGRTKNELKKKGTILFNAVKNNIQDIKEEECYHAVIYRVIGETWNGIVLREKNTISTLQKKFPKLHFVKQSGEFDFNYAVDFELYKEHQLICAVQIKPKSYTYNTPYLTKAKRANVEKNKKYTAAFNVPVFNVISSAKGFLYNEEILTTLKNLLK